MVVAVGSDCRSAGALGKNSPGFEVSFLHALVSSIFIPIFTFVSVYHCISPHHPFLLIFITYIHLICISHFVTFSFCYIVIILHLVYHHRILFSDSISYHLIAFAFVTFILSIIQPIFHQFIHKKSEISKQQK